MSFMKDLYIEEYERIASEAEEAGKTLTDDEIGRLADAASIDRFADMCDEAKDRAKYRDCPSISGTEIVSPMPNTHMRGFNANREAREIEDDFHPSNID